MLSDFMSTIQDVIHEVNPSQELHMNMSRILNSYREMGTQNLT